MEKHFFFFLRFIKRRRERKRTSGLEGKGEQRILKLTSWWVWSLLLPRSLGPSPWPQPKSKAGHQLSHPAAPGSIFLSVFFATVVLQMLLKKFFFQNRVCLGMLQIMTPSHLYSKSLLKLFVMYQTLFLAQWFASTLHAVSVFHQFRAVSILCSTEQ